MTHAIRLRSRWLRGQRARSAEEVGDAAAVSAFRLARAMLANMRRTGFAIDAGAPYFSFLAEALSFAIQCACRAAWPRLDECERPRFAAALAHACARHLAENEAELLGARTPAEIHGVFIEGLNRRFAEYAELGYGPEGPDFAFLRYFASRLAELVPPTDARWVHDQVIAIEAPVAAAAMARTLDGLLDSR